MNHSGFGSKKNYMNHSGFGSKNNFMNHPGFGSRNNFTNHPVFDSENNFLLITLVLALKIISRFSLAFDMDNIFFLCCK